MLTMSGPVTTVSILFSIFPAKVLTSSSSRSLASWEQNRGDQTYNSQTTEVPTAEELGYSFEMQMPMKHTEVRRKVPEFGVEAEFCD